jgi:hypothetical protein
MAFPTPADLADLGRFKSALQSSLNSLSGEAKFLYFAAHQFANGGKKPLLVVTSKVDPFLQAVTTAPKARGTCSKADDANGTIVFDVQNGAMTEKVLGPALTALGVKLANFKVTGKGGTDDAGTPPQPEGVTGQAVVAPTLPPPTQVGPMTTQAKHPELAKLQKEYTDVAELPETIMLAIYIKYHALELLVVRAREIAAANAGDSAECAAIIAEVEKKMKELVALGDKLQKALAARFRKLSAAEWERMLATAKLKEPALSKVTDALKQFELANKRADRAQAAADKEESAPQDPKHALMAKIEVVGKLLAAARKADKDFGTQNVALGDYLLAAAEEEKAECTTLVKQMTKASS